eukprot:gene32897-39783_t
MGNADSNPIRNMDKRTSRREYKEDFVRGINLYKQRLIPAKSKAMEIEEACEWQNGDLKVFMRKRPIFPHELAAGEFDVITCVGQREVVIHDARMHADMKRQMLNHHHFVYDRVFSESVDNAFVYKHAAQPLVQIACQGGYATAMVYGQTGSGKTFTMSSIYSQASTDIFKYISDIRSQTPPTVTVSMVEVAGDTIHDLLNTYSVTHTRMASDGGVHIFPVVECAVASAEDLMGVIQHGVNVRSTAATGVHDGSSRSHAIVRIYIQRHDLQSSSKEYVEGTLTLVDLAGSEHKIDSMYHSGDRRKETSQINASLSALKECIRHRAMSMNSDTPGTLGQHVYRKSKLTLALKSSFVLPTARTVVICTVSPASKDTEHSVNTLRHACLMLGDNAEAEEGSGKASFIRGGKTTTEYIGEVNVAQIARMAKMQKKLHGEVGDLKTSNGNQGGSKTANTSSNASSGELSDKAKRKARKVSEMRSFNSLAPSVQKLLVSHRQQLRSGGATYQTRRMRGAMVAGGVEEVEEDQDENDHEIEEDIQFPSSGHHTQNTQEYEDDFEASDVHTQSHSVPTHRHAQANTPKPQTPTSSRTQAHPNVPSLAQLYDCIHLVKDMVHPHTLRVQLHAVARLLGYSYTQVEDYVTDREKREMNPQTKPADMPHNQRAQTPVNATHTVQDPTHVKAVNLHAVPSLGDVHSVDIHHNVQIQSTRQNSASTLSTVHTPRSVVQANASVSSTALAHTPTSLANARPKSPYKRHFSTQSTATESSSSAQTNVSQTPRSSTPSGNRIANTSTPSYAQVRSHTPSRAPSQQASVVHANSDAQSSQEVIANARYQEAQLALQREAEKKRARQERALQVVRDKEAGHGHRVGDIRAGTGGFAGADDKLVQHQRDLQELLQVIEEDKQKGVEHKMSSAKMYGLKKQLALLRA